MSLDVGSVAPQFSLPDAEGNEISLASLKGRKAVVYFYPKDDTSGCTKEAQEFTALRAEFDSAETTVIGISPDSPASKAKFGRKYGLNVTLAADERKGTVADYGVWVEKSMYGRKYMGVERTTFLINRDGTIARIWPKVSVPGHAKDVLEAAKSL